MKKALIIGGGFAGCAAAHQLELLQGWDVTIIEKGPFLGAGVRTSWFGGHPYTFGPRHFLTPYLEVYDYLNSIIPLRKCGEHEFLTYVESDNDFYAYPINMRDIRNMPDFPKINSEMEDKKKEEFYGAKNAKNLEEYWIGSVGQTLFNKFIDNYNKKMWLVDSCKDIDTFNWSPKGVALKDGPRAAWDSAISAYPIASNGYNDYFDISTKNAKVLLKTIFTKIDLKKKLAVINNEKFKFDIIVNTISPDLLFEECYGKLNFLGREFHKIVFPSENVFPENVYFLYYANDEKFTRMVEFKKFQNINPNLIGWFRNSSLGGNIILFHLKDQKLAQKYLDDLPDGYFSIGRAGTYLVCDIDDCIRQTMIMSEMIKSEVIIPVLEKNIDFQN